MPKFHFDVYDGAGIFLDEEGRELASLEVAKKEAIKGIRSLIMTDVEKGLLDLTGRLVIRDAAGSSAWNVGFDEVVTIKGEWLPPTH